MTMMYRHVGRLSDGEVRGIRDRASALRHEFGVEG